MPNTCPTGEDGSALDHNTKGIAINITHDDTATSWRDLTDQLTPEQVRRFEHFEAMALNRSAMRHRTSMTPRASP